MTELTYAEKLLQTEYFDTILFECGKSEEDALQYLLDTGFIVIPDYLIPVDVERVHQTAGPR